jgi:hypothetical protein
VTRLTASILFPINNFRAEEGGLGWKPKGVNPVRRSTLLPLLRRLIAPSRGGKRHGLRVTRTTWSLGVFRQETVEIEHFDDRD